MCRWFCYISADEPQLLEDILIKPRHSLIKQIDSHYLPDVHIEFKASDDGSPNPTTNMDGFGLGYWSAVAEEFRQIEQGTADEGVLSKAGAGSSTRQGDGMGTMDMRDEDMRPLIYKSTRPPLNDLNLKSLCAGTKSKGVLAHIRAGTGLTPVVETNNHPFAFGRYLFAHNGTLSKYAAVKLPLLQSLSPAARNSILGTTDSEHMAALFFDRLSKGTGDWQTGRRYDVALLRDTMRQILGELEGWIAQAKQADAAAGIAEDEREHSALNLVCTDGTSLVATRYASPLPREPPSLYFSTTAGAKFNRKFGGHPDEGHPAVSQRTAQGGSIPPEEHGRHVIVASEPSTYDAADWTLIGVNEMVLVDRDMKVHREAI